MNCDPLVDQMFSSKESDAIKSLYKEEPSCRKAIAEAVSSKLITDREKIIVSSQTIDVLYLICLSSKFADSEDECLRVANIIYSYRGEVVNILPSIVYDRGLKLANKTLVALSLYPQALEKQWRQRGAPKPSFYRNISKTIFYNNQQEDISSHHEQWEHFLAEVLI